MTSTGEDRKKLIIDCDAGIDDAQAIFLALSENDVDVLAITCVYGNVNVDQVCANVLKILEVCGRTDIPVFKGADRGLLGHQYDLPGYHGEDGLGDAKNIKDSDLSLIKQNHAVEVLVQLATEHAGHLNIAALGPLTNIALACRMDPSFGKNTKSLSAMGGNKHGKGNHFVSAEFNFGADPEAAHVVLKEMECHVTLITWELCLEHTMEWDFFYEYVGRDTPKSRFMKKISSKIQEYEAGGPFMTCDPFVVSVIVEPEMVTHSETVHAVVELSGQNTRGQMVVDWRGVLSKQHNVIIVHKIDLEIFKKMMLKSIEQ